MTHIDIPFDKTTLTNGLRVIVHEDRKTPVVAVSVWYHVGSKNDQPGKTGFAHLFEHLMFEGSAHHQAEHFRPLEDAGASVINGTTNRDRTNYFETVPSGALDLALWLESDRMGHLTMTQEKLDEQRDVVRNEKKQSDNQPYGKVGEALSAALYPTDHPYSWPIIGHLEDLDAAALDDVQQWFDNWYVPNNAVVVLSGDVDAATGFRQVEEAFGSLSPGPPLDRPGTWVAPLEGARRLELEDRVPQARVYRAWNVPPHYQPESHRLGLLAKALTWGKTSRLYKRLVYDERLATDVSAQTWSGEIGGSFLIQATATPGVAPARIEAVLDEEIERLRQESLGSAELERAQRRVLTGFVRGVERVGGFGGKSEALAHGEVFRGDPGAFRESLEAAQSARPDEIREVVQNWLTDSALTVVAHPHREYSVQSADVDRSSTPRPESTRTARLSFPATRRLANGLEVALLQRTQLPLTEFRLVSAGGHSADPEGRAGTATLTMAAIDEGAGDRTALEISDHLATLGAHLGCGAGLDHCRLSISSLSETSGEALAVLADVVLAPTFPPPEIDRLKAEQTARIGRELVAPVSMAMRVLPRYLYGESHPYGSPFTGSGSVASVAHLERSDLVDFRRWLDPGTSTLLCLGDLDPDETFDTLERLFVDWRTTSPFTVELPEAQPAEEPRILLIDRPDSIQSIVFGGQLVPPHRHSSTLALEAFQQALGGSFTSRLNLNLREDKGWTYGAHSLLWSARGDQPFLLYSSVQADATANTIREMDGELRRMLGEDPIGDDELDRVRRQLTLSLPGRWETLADIATDFEEILSSDLPRDYFETYAGAVGALDPESVTRAATEWIDPDRFLWVVVGDLASVRADIEALDWAVIEEIDGGAL